LSRRRKPVDVPLARDESWWLHPAFRGQQTLPLTDTGVGALPHRWVRSDASQVAAEAGVDDASGYADLSRILYTLNGYRPGPVRGFYVIVESAPNQYAVGQLCADPQAPVQLFEDLIFSSEAEARAKAAAMRAEESGPPRR